MNLLRRPATAVLVALMLVSPALSSAHAIAYELVPVGNPGNANDPATGNSYGGVAYDYQIGKYHVTIGQYTAFLNAVAATDPYSLYDASMASNLNIAGISQNGSSGSYTYSVIGSTGNKPITYVSWFDAARFANWMHNGQGMGSTETGAYTLVGGQTSGTAPAKNLGAQFYIPTENEWYKAAYYSPVLNSGSGGYYTYATQSNTDPGNVVGPSANQANYYNGVHSVTQSASYSPSQNYLTDVGAFTNSASFYGTFDQSGNTMQWNDLDGTPGSDRGVRGGIWNDGSARNLSSSRRATYDPSVGFDYIFGFRLASPVAVPEPSTWVMGLAGIACAGWGAVCRRKRA
jgi:sulfatase modifying factor 1